MFGARLPKLKRGQLILTCLVVVLLVASTIVGILANRGQPTGLDYNLALLTGQLYSNSQKLQNSFNQQGSSGQLAKSYLAYMQDFQTECQKVSAYSITNQQSIAAGTAARLSNSQALCQDLAKLAKDSQTIYTAVLPLLTANAQLKFYQTIWSSRLKNQQSSQVASAIKQLQGPVSQLGFPSQTLIWLQQLQTTINKSKGLAYYPAVANFQSQMLAERAQYWLDYGDLANLVQTLKLQLQGYCQNLAGSQPKVCKAA